MAELENDTGANLAESLIAGLAEGVVACDADARPTLANPAALRLHALESLPALAVTRWGELCPICEPETGRPLAAEELPIALALRGVEVRERELALRPRGAPPRLVRVHARPIAGGGAVATILDETERAEALRELRLDRHQLAEAQSIARVGSFEWDVEAGEVWCSEQHCRNLGLDPARGRVPLAAVLDRVHPEDRGLVAELAAGTEDRTAGRMIEFRVVHPDGGTLVIEGRDHPVRGPDGRPRRAGTSRDVTREREAERALREAEERFRRAFQDSTSGMALIAGRGRRAGSFLDVNAALIRISGRPAEELLAMSCWELVHPADREPIRERIEALLRGEEESLHVEERIVGAEGDVRWVDFGVSLIRDASGAPLSAVVQARETTDRKRLEQELRYLADHDPLTGLLNRRRFGAELDRELALASRYGTAGALLLVDVDNLKRVNDSLGHAAGDELLVRIAGTITTRLRGTDVVGRLGGDEFGIILPHADAVRARLVAEDLRAQVGAATGRGTAGEPASLSIGIALLGEGARSRQHVVAEADAAMYQAKQAGRNRVRLGGRIAVT